MPMPMPILAGYALVFWGRSLEHQFLSGRIRKSFEIPAVAVIGVLHETIRCPGSGQFA